jgi:hypothetical protein
MFTVSHRARVDVYDWATKGLVRTIDVDSPKKAIVANDSSFVLIHNSSRIDKYSIYDGSLMGSIDGEMMNPLLSADDEYVFVRVLTDRKFWLSRIRTDDLVIVNVIELDGNDVLLRVDPDSRTVYYYSSKSKSIVSVNTDTRMTSNIGKYETIAVSPTGNAIVLVRFSKIFLNTNRRMIEVWGREGPMTFTWDGSTLIIANGTDLELHLASTGEFLGRIPFDHRVESISSSPISEEVMIVLEHSVRIVNIVTGTEVVFRIEHGPQDTLII